MQVTILIVDDSEFFLMLLKSLLDRSGCKVLTATTGDEARKMVLKEKPSLILLDQNLSDMKGHDLCREIKKTPTSKDTSVIMISASHRQEDIDLCRAAGCEAYVKKPIDKENLLKVITRILPVAGRRYPRAPICEGIRYFHNDVDYAGHIHVISQGGAFIMGEKMFPPNDILRLDFSISNIHDTLSVKGRVVWNFDTKEKFPQLLATAQGMGIEFTEIGEDAKNAIIKYIHLGNFLV